MKKLLSASILSFLLFGAVSLSDLTEGKFEVRDTLADTFTNEATGRRVKVKRANDVETTISDEIKVQQRYDEESGTYDFRFVAGISSVEVDKAEIKITMGGKTASKYIYKAYERMMVGTSERTAQEVFGDGYNYLLAYVLADVPSSAVTTNFDVAVNLVADDVTVDGATRNLTLSDIVDLDFTPSIEFSNNDALAVVAGSEVILPTYTVTNSVASTWNVNVTSSGNGTIANGAYTPNVYSETGVHTLTYTAVNPHTGKEVVLGYKEINVAQKILSGATVNMVTVENELTNPVIKNTDTGCSGLSFNFEASKHYYAEFEMAAISSYVNNSVIGFSHNISPNGYATEGAYYNGFKMNSSSYEFAHSRYQTGWSLNDARMWIGSSYANRSKVTAPSIDKNATKIAVARDGDKFYLFINDGLYNVCYYPELQEKNTYPGILFENNPTYTSFSNFTFIRNAEDVASKISSLVGVTTFDHYTRWGSSLANDYLDFDITNGVTFSDRGREHDDYNSNMASPYIHLGGAWTAEFDYKLGDTNWAGFHIDIRTVWDSFSVMDMRMVSWTNNFGESVITTEVGSLSVTSMLNELQGLTHRNNIHFTITCTPGDGIETYTITMSDGNVTKTVTQVVTFSNYSYMVGSAKYFIFKSQKWIGTISNFVASTNAA